MFCVKKLLLVASFLALTACGDSKVTEVNGASTALANKSINEMMMGMDGQERFKIEIDLKMVKARYKGEEFAKVMAGKNLDEVKQEIADTRKYFTAQVRDKFRADNESDAAHVEKQKQEWIDLKLSTRPNFVAEDDIFVVGFLNDLRNIKLRQEQQDALTDDEFFKKHGCAC